MDVPDQVINGALTFSGNLSSTASIDLDDGYLVNGLDLSEDVVLTHGEQRITGEERNLSWGVMAELIRAPDSSTGVADHPECGLELLMHMCTPR